MRSLIIIAVIFLPIIKFIQLIIHLFTGQEFTGHQNNKSYSRSEYKKAYNNNMHKQNRIRQDFKDKVLHESMQNQFQQDFNNQILQDNLQNQLQQDMNNQQLNESIMSEFMDFSMNSVTPFEHGGFDMNQGNSFNDPNLF